MTVHFERRFFTGEVREVPVEDGQPKIRGYAAMFNVMSEDLGDFVEVIEPGAFSDVLNDDVRALSDHVPHRILGRNKAGTLRIWQDEIGLGYEIDTPDTTVGRDLTVSLRRGDVDQSSFGFGMMPSGAEWSKLPDGRRLRTIKKVARLYDVSPVTFPAYLATQSEMRALMGIPDVPEEFLEDVPAGVRGATAPAVEDGDGLRAQWSQRERQIEILASA